MSAVDEIIKELQNEELIDNFGEGFVFTERRLSIPKIYKSRNLVTSEETEPSSLTREIADSLAKRSEIRYSMSALTASEAQYLPQPRLRLYKKQSRFNRSCRCCNSNVFFLDAFCSHCNERMIGNFLYYSFYLVSALMIGFVVFYISISNPY